MMKQEDDRTSNRLTKQIIARLLINGTISSLAAHDLDPIDSQDCARNHEVPLFN
jgi:hypothetical protein